MKVGQDYVDLFAAFNAHEVEYLVVGAHALAAYGHIRATKDIDVWVRPTSANVFSGIGEPDTKDTQPI